MKHDLSLIELSRELERVGCGIVVRREPPTPCKRVPMPSHCRSKEAWDAIRAVSDRTGVSVEAIIGRSRATKVTNARAEAMRAVAAAVGWVPSPGNSRKAVYWSSVRMGELFGRDHTTILKALGRLPNKGVNRREA